MWEGTKWERPNWERPKWEKHKWERPKWERPKWERVQSSRAVERSASSSGGFAQAAHAMSCTVSASMSWCALLMSSKASE